MSEQQPEGLPYGIIDPDYARTFTIARATAWQYGYALAMHGSFTRDLDLIAVPWTEHAASAEHLVKVIAHRAGLTIQDPPAKAKPHGRTAWSLLFPEPRDPRFVDLSVMPRAAAPQQGDSA